MANIYVRKSGSDSNSGSTPALAKLTIAGAVSAMGTNDIIYIGSGIYRESNISAGNKDVNIVGDITGEYTGDAGEVIWSGLNSTDDGYLEGKAISNGSGYVYSFKNIIFSNWSAIYILYKFSGGNINIENVKIKDVYYTTRGPQRVCPLYLYTTTGDSCTIKNLLMENINVFQQNNGAGLQNLIHAQYIDIENVKIKNWNICASNSTITGSEIQGLYIESDLNNYTEATIKNIEIDGLTCINSYDSDTQNFIEGIYISTSGTSSMANTYNVSVRNLRAYNTVGKNCIVRGIYTKYKTTGGVHYTPSVYNLVASSGTPVKYYDDGSATTVSNAVDKANYDIPVVYEISKYSPLCGVGSSGPTKDIKGNPRPKYGNVYSDISPIESTSDNVQKESTVKDSGDFSMKVSPCNYFKREFQIPVTASELRTVKAKIRIDGTWGDYRPKITLSGQGMTLNSATKNATTGSFEELTVSGTPTTTGIALLTVEAHSTSTDAIMYLDTITIE